MMAKGLEENGAKVYIIGRRLATLEAAANQAVSIFSTATTRNLLTSLQKHGNIIPMQGDLTKKDGLYKDLPRQCYSGAF
jgi:hypothetical protein